MTLVSLVACSLQLPFIPACASKKNSMVESYNIIVISSDGLFRIAADHDTDVDLISPFGLG